MSEKNGMGPVFDLSNVSYKWMKNLTKVSRRMMKYQLILSLPEPDEPSLKVQLVADKLAALDALDDDQEQRDIMLAEVIVSIPRGWLVDSAPMNIDGDWLDYVRGEKIAAVVEALAEAQNEQKETSKN